MQLKVRDDRLGEASELQHFLQNLDHFQQWLTRTQTAVATEDIPNDLAEAEKLLNEHQQIKEEIDGYAPEYNTMKDYGSKVVEGQEDVQYMFLREVSHSKQHLYVYLNKRKGKNPPTTKKLNIKSKIMFNCPYFLLFFV